jgi:hypothetical protein
LLAIACAHWFYVACALCYLQLPHYSKGQHLRKAGHLSNQLLAMACAEQPFCLPFAL